MNKTLVISGYPVTWYRWSDGKQVEKHRYLVAYLIEKYGVCYFCNKPVKTYPHKDGVGAQDDLATIDHLIPRPERKKRQIVQKVLACYKCNHDRNVEYQTKGKK
jgi:hypothetical protein